MKIIMGLWIVFLTTIGHAQLVCETSSAKQEAININTATLEELSTKLKGIGKAKAAAILEWREINGKFQSLEDVDEVKGIGPAILEADSITKCDTFVSG